MRYEGRGRSTIANKLDRFPQAVIVKLIMGKEVSDVVRRQRIRVQTVMRRHEVSRHGRPNQEECQNHDDRNRTHLRTTQARIE